MLHLLRFAPWVPKTGPELVDVFLAGLAAWEGHLTIECHG